MGTATPGDFEANCRPWDPRAGVGVGFLVGSQVNWGLLSRR